MYSLERISFSQKYKSEICDISYSKRIIIKIFYTSRIKSIIEIKKKINIDNNLKKNKH